MKVFISYSHTDEKLARRVAAILEETGLDVWDDRREIMPGDNWAAKVALALQESDAMVVLLTPEALRSSWVRREIEYALGDKGYSKRLIPVLVSPQEKIPEGDIPWILRHLESIKLDQHSKEEESIRQIAQALLHTA